MTKQSENHLFILWEKGRYQQERILNDIRQHFEVRNLIEVLWTEKHSALNFSRFYGEHLPSNSEKEEECGIGAFLVVVVKDHTPVYEERNTTRGLQTVNANMFDAKTRYRLWTNDGHKIHATNNETESNHDITMLFGLNMHDFCEQYKPEPDAIIHKECDIVGVEGWNSLSQLFYVLNNTTKYCVLRNYEILPDSFCSELHGDIDLLVENREEARWIVNATAEFPEEYRVYSKARINNEDVFFDFRYIGDSYYDEQWEKNILANAQLHPKGFYVPSLEDYFYSLLYHAYIQKYEIASDYVERFQYLSKQLNIPYTSDNAMTLLDRYMDEHMYEYIRPYDESVRYNEVNLKKSNYAYRHGTCFQILDMSINGERYTSKVFRNDKFYVKKGTPNLVANEYKHLERLQGKEAVPELLTPLIDERDHVYFEMQNVEGMNPVAFYGYKYNHTPQLVKSFISEMWRIILSLHNVHSIHRDLLPSNVLVAARDGKCMVRVIDFGWAIDYAEKDHCVLPDGLANDNEGISFRAATGSSDFYSFSIMLRKIWGHRVPYVNRICEVLSTFTSDDYDNLSKLDEKIETVSSMINNELKPADRVRLFLLRHRTIYRYCRKISKKLKKL